jgi:CRP-like cAMP-binding protein
MDRRSAKTGEVLFRKGDEADRLFFVLEGKLRILEIGVIVNAGNIVGELGMLAPGRKRSQTIVAEADTRLLQISYARIEELYFQNPTFGFYFLKLSTARLFENVARLERELSLRDAEIRRLTAAPLPEASLKQA